MMTSLQQMTYLLPELLRVTIPGRFAIVHCKDRIIYGSRNNGVRHIEPFSDKVTTAMRQHGWLFYGRITVATDPVRENAQTNNLPYSELKKDASRFGVGMPEYLLLFRRPHTATAEGGQWSDERVDSSTMTITAAALAARREQLLALVRREAPAAALGSRAATATRRTWPTSKSLIARSCWAGRMASRCRR
jgi:hypothetical protein